jgi:hypothetical protein
MPPNFPTLRQALVFGPLVFSWMAVIHPALELFSKIDRQYDRMAMNYQNHEEEFDFIIGKMYKLQLIFGICPFEKYVFKSYWILFKSEEALLDVLWRINYLRIIPFFCWRLVEHRA